MPRESRLAESRLPSRWLARVLGPGAIEASILGDLLEDFHRLAAERGSRFASLWLWVEALRLMFAFGLWHRGRQLLMRPEDGDRSWVPLTQTEETSMRDSLTFHDLGQDLRFALRGFRREWAPYALAILTIGVGVAATTSVYSVIRPLMLEPLPFEKPEELVWLANTAGAGMSGVTSRTANLRDFRAQATSFEAISGFNAFFEQDTYNLVGNGEPMSLVGVDVAYDFLDVLGIEVARGRGFVEEEGLRRWRDVGVVILSYDFWQRHYRGDLDVLGRTVSLNGVPNEIVGVLPGSFDFASIFNPRARVDFLRPMPITDETDRDGNTWSIIGRLAPDSDLLSAQAELDLILRRLKEADPGRWGLGAQVTGLREQIAGSFRPALLLLVAAAAVVMAIVCVNLSNLLLSRGLRRRKEMAVRSALGAPRGRLLRQMLVEVLLLSSGGALVGTGLAFLVVRLVSRSGIDIPTLDSVTVDGAVLLFSLIMATCSGLAAGLLPALRASSGSQALAMRRSGRGASSDRGGVRMREVLVVAQVAMACVLLVFGGLLLQSFAEVLEVELGFEPSKTLAWQVRAERDFEELREETAFYGQIREAVAAVPGVSSVGLTDAVPLGRNRTWTVMTPENRHDKSAWHDVYPHIVDHRYLPTLRVPLKAGRHFAATDDLGQELVAIVNETAAKALFPGENAVGRLLRISGEQHRIVGIAADMRHRTLEDDAGSQLYLPFTQVGDFATLELVVRAEVSGEGVIRGVAAAVHSVDPTIPVTEIQSLEGIVDRSVAPRRFTLLVLGGFAAVGLLLAALGIYGVLSFAVTERAYEIGIRMALGESAAGVQRRVVGRTLMLTSVGIVVGAIVAILLSRLIESLLFGVEATNPGAFVAMAVVLLGVAAMAGLAPALRASRTDPLVVLRNS